MKKVIYDQHEITIKAENVKYKKNNIYILRQKKNNGKYQYGLYHQFAEGKGYAIELSCSDNRWGAFESFHDFIMTFSCGLGEIFIFESFEEFVEWISKEIEDNNFLSRIY